MNRWSLARGVVHVEGPRNSALYDLRQKRIFWLDAESSGALSNLITARSSCKQLTQEDPELVSELLREGLITIDQERPQSNRHLDERVPTVPTEIVWLEMGTGCNHKCAHCYNESDPTGLHSSPSVDILANALLQLPALGTKHVVFLGGEPLAYRAECEVLLRLARSLPFETVSLHTNGTLVDEFWSLLFAKLRIQVRVTVYSDEASVHDSISGVFGSFLKTVAGLARLSTADVATTITLIVMPENESQLKRARAYYRNRFPRFVFIYDYIRPVGRALMHYQRLTFEHLNRYRQHFTHFGGVDETSFLLRKHYNPCLANKLMITAEGDVAPCIMLRDICGSALGPNGIAGVVRSTTFRSYKELSLNHVEVCRDCEFRYACSDCRPIAIGTGGGIRGKPPECPYDPYSGTLTSIPNRQANTFRIL